LETLKGGRIKRIEKYIDSEEFFLTYGDGLSNINIDKLLEFHRHHGKTGTLSAVRPPSRFGMIDLQGNKVKNFDEKPQMSEGYINGGFFVMNKKIFSYLTDSEKCDFEFGPLDNLAKSGELMAYTHDGFWQCMDTKREKDHLEKLWENNKALWKTWE
jgi:glucose-1-phosphate cytidylyltransferase